MSRHRSRKSPSPCAASGRLRLMNLYWARCRKGSGCEDRGCAGWHPCPGYPEPENAFLGAVGPPR
jgi:hypothetical protein